MVRCRFTHFDRHWREMPASAASCAMGPCVDSGERGAVSRQGSAGRYATSLWESGRWWSGKGLIRSVGVRSISGTRTR
jgi:hypothetical protein